VTHSGPPGRHLRSAMADVHKDYLYDLGFELKLRALDAKKARDRAGAGTAERTFQEGRLLAFNEVISVMQQQAVGLTPPIA
jgi:hypothetical protein